MLSDVEKRKIMVQTQIKARGIKDLNTLFAMESIPRHLFVPEQVKEYAYEDAPLPIQEGQTISQPYIVALMNELAEISADSKVLDIGTGSGYAAAIAAYTAKEVYSIERIQLLSETAESLFKKLEIKNIKTVIGDGSKGLKQYSPYDAIIVAAGAPVVPKHLLEQLKIGGRLVIPVGDDIVQTLIKIKKINDTDYVKEAVIDVRFVPLIGQDGWRENEQSNQ